jgi:outer membrane biosynthesis protein TonB
MRQQITPTPPVAPPPPQRPTEAPVQAADPSKDKFNPKQDDTRGGRREQTVTDEQRASTMSKLRGAYLRLSELQREVGAAQAAGDATRAKELASEAADVARTIPASVGILLLAAQENGQDMPSSSGTAGGGASIPATFDIARAGLGAAKDVVESAASIPYHPIADRIAINGMRHQVLDAMAGVENYAANAAAPATAILTGGAQHIDLNA